MVKECNLDAIKNDVKASVVGMILDKKGSKEQLEKTSKEISTLNCRTIAVKYARGVMNDLVKEIESMAKTI